MVSHDWRACGSRLHGNVPTGTELLYFSFHKCGDSGGKSIDEKEIYFCILFLFNFLFRKSVIEFKIQERLCLWQMKHDL